jgi:hypothetical protein
MRKGEVAIDEQRLRAELPEFLGLLENVAGWVGGLDLEKVREVPAEALSDLRDGLLRAIGFLHELFAWRGDPPPSPAPGIAFGSLGPSLRRTLPQRLAAQLADELNAMPGSRLEDLTQFTALGLFSRVTDLLRFVGFLEGERAGAGMPAAPPTIVSARVPKRRPAKAAPSARPAPAAEAQAAPPVPDGPGPDLSAYDIRIDEAGERIEAEGGWAWFASAPGPVAGREGLAASFAVRFPGGVALAVADGAESSLGARLAAVVAVRAFCRAAGASPAAAGTAAATAQGHLEMLLSALLASGDASPALARVRCEVPPGNARRILAHTRRPEEALRRVAPALATGLVGAVAVAAPGGLTVSVLRLGPGSAQVRISGRVTPLLAPPGSAPAGFLGPGLRGSEEIGRLEAAPTVVLAPGDALLLGTAALARGSENAWQGLVTLWPGFPDDLTSGGSARDLLRRAERWGKAEPPAFGGALAFGLLLAR